MVYESKANDGSDMDKGNADLAAGWWADQLRQKPAFDNGVPLHGAMFGMVADLKEPLEDKAIDAFRRFLSERICVHEPWSIDVDYEPDRTLQHAAEAAGIDLSYRLPVKTYMMEEKGVLKVSQGYRAPYKEVEPSAS